MRFLVYTKNVFCNAHYSGVFCKRNVYLFKHFSKMGIFYIRLY